MICLMFNVIFDIWKVGQSQIMLSIDNIINYDWKTVINICEYWKEETTITEKG